MKRFITVLMFLTAGLVGIIGVMAFFDKKPITSYVLPSPSPSPSFQPLSVSSLLKYSVDKDVMIGSSTRKWGGTAFEIIAPSGKHYTITNKHVCATDTEMFVDPFVRTDNLKIKVIKTSDTSDLCLLEPIAKTKAYKMAKKEAAVYEYVYVIGHPHLGPTTFVEGYIRSKNTHAEEKNEPVELLHQTSLIVFHGNSGSPVFNSKNEVVGVISRAEQDTNFGWFVPLKDLKEFLKGM